MPEESTPSPVPPSAPPAHPTDPPIAASPPLTPSPKPQARDELDEVRRRLLELQSALTDRFSRQTWDEFIRLRRAVKAQHV